jgi:acid phosphatase (class A)
MRHFFRASAVPVFFLALLVCSPWAAGCRHAPPDSASPGRVATSADAARSRPGYLQPAERPNSVAILPPPPGDGTAQFAADQQVYRATRALRDTPRWRMAASDANVKFPQAANTFACATGVTVSQQATPNLYALLQRTIVDAGQSTSLAKDKYQRPRPYLVNAEPTCVPEDEEILRKSGSFPSGHASLGWVWALLLTELVPDRADAILARGYAFGQSRVICGVHWQSDVDAGLIIGAAVAARLHANPEFQSQLQAAAKEVARARANPVAPAADCAAEAAALSDNPLP